jgi:hypothetical protein
MVLGELAIIRARAVPDETVAFREDVTDLEQTLECPGPEAHRDVPAHIG